LVAILTTARPTGLSAGTFIGAAAYGLLPACGAGTSRPAGTLVTLLDKGLIGFDVETGSRIVRPELLRLLNRGTNTTADEQYALAA
jgi:hypothetical protein